MTSTTLLLADDRFEFSVSDLIWQSLLTNIELIEIEIDKKVLSSLVIVDDSDESVPDDSDLVLNSMYTGNTENIVKRSDIVYSSQTNNFRERIIGDQKNENNGKSECNEKNEKIYEVESGRSSPVQRNRDRNSPQKESDRRTRRLRSMKGRPYLHIFYTDPHTPGPRAQNQEKEMMKTQTQCDNVKEEERDRGRESNTDNSVNNSSGNREDKEEKVTEKIKSQNIKSTDFTDRLNRRTLQFADHESLVEFLEILLKIAPKLKNKETDKYFAFCGVQSTGDSKSQKNSNFEIAKKTFFSSQVEEINFSPEKKNENLEIKIGKVKEIDVSEVSKNTFFAKIDYATGKIILSPVIDVKDKKNK